MTPTSAPANGGFLRTALGRIRDAIAPGYRTLSTGSTTAYARDVEDDKPPANDDDFIKLALERFHMVAEAEDEVRRQMLDDLEFYAGDQWDDTVKRSREMDKRPCLTVNRLPQFVHQVSNQIRQNAPSVKVSPVDSEGDIETAEIIQGLYRHIETQSNATAVRSYASFYQIVSGRGYYRILTKRADPYSFDQEIIIQRIKNPATVYIDPTAQEPDYSDAKWAFIVEDLTRAEFKAQYPEQSSAGEEFRSVGDSDPDWASKDSIRVAEYFTRDLEQVEVGMLADGSVIRMENLLPGTQIVATRTATVPRVKWSKITCYEVLERRDWPGRWIPIVPVLGEEFDEDGKTQLLGMVRNAKDPQRMLNYWESAKTETIALAPRAPYVAAEGQLENHEKEWAQANTRNFAYLTYKPMSLSGALMPPPQRQVYEPPIQAISLAEGAAIDHMKAATGIYDASLGNRSNETSGIAIRQRQSEGDVANYHFLDNLNTAITYEAKIVIDLIPYIYDRPGRVIRIIGEEGSERQVMTTSAAQPVPGEALQQFQQKFGQVQKIYDLRMGNYDITVDIGPSYATKRQAASDAMLQFAKVAPGLLPQFADLMVQAMDFPMAQEIADRIRPPGAAPPGSQPPIPPQAQAALAQMQQQNQQLQAVVGQLSDLLQKKTLELQSKERMQTQQIESDERIATMQTQAETVQKAADIGSRDSIALLNAEINALNARLKQLGANQPVEAGEELTPIGAAPQGPPSNPPMGPAPAGPIMQP